MKASWLTHDFLDTLQHSAKQIHRDGTSPDIDVSLKGHAGNQTKIARYILEIGCIHRASRLVISVVERLAIIVRRKSALADPTYFPARRTVRGRIEGIDLHGAGISS